MRESAIKSDANLPAQLFLKFMFELNCAPPTLTYIDIDKVEP
jgi:hypothetical protein